MMSIFKYNKWSTKPKSKPLTLNKPRYSLRKGYRRFTSLTLLAIRKILSLGLDNWLLCLLDLLLLLLLLLLHIRWFRWCWFYYLMATISTRWNMSSFCVLSIIRVTVLIKPIWVIVTVWSQLLYFLKYFFHRWRGSRELCMPIPAIRTIWTKSQLVPAPT